MRIFLRLEINGIQVKVFQDGIIECLHYRGPFNCKNKIKKWRVVKGSIRINPDGYISHHTHIGKDWIKTSRLIAMHLQGFDYTNPKQSIDHIDRNSLNNRLENLRISNPLQQSLNRDCVINARGAYPVKDRNGIIYRWKACIHRGNKFKYLGIFKTEEEAHQAYLQAVNS